ncbi:MAG TPA: glycosyltransferase, partial [Vicinamibacterales bacterium]|nr:glycosyltransferase [Vicinamibacterales bacterium]
ATDVGGVREALADAGVLVCPRQPGEIANAIVDLLNCPEKRRALGNAARARALEHFTEQTFAAGYRKAYQDLVTSQATDLAKAS